MKGRSANSKQTMELVVAVFAPLTGSIDHVIIFKTSMFVEYRRG